MVFIIVYSFINKVLDCFYIEVFCCKFGFGIVQCYQFFSGIQLIECYFKVLLYCMWYGELVIVCVVDIWQVLVNVVCCFWMGIIGECLRFFVE